MPIEDDDRAIVREAWNRRVLPVAKGAPHILTHLGAVVCGVPQRSRAQDPSTCDRFGAAPLLCGDQDRHGNVVIQHFGNGSHDRQAHQP
jgi:hypothetical protein